MKKIFLNSLNKILILKKIKDIKKLINFDKNVFYIVDYLIWKLKFKKINTKRFFFIKHETYKNIKIINIIIKKMLDNNIKKKDYLIAIGGGVTIDISGFISSIYFRGINYLIIPTTLLSQVDSSIGGKNGINILSGKNCIGTIYQPLCVFICLEFLYTLSFEDYINGFSEILKISIINNKSLFFLLKSNLFFLFNKKINYFLKEKILTIIILMSIKSKLHILKKDLYDIKYRMLLNLGHTFSHALENYFNYLFSHGKILYSGIYLACLISHKLNLLKKKTYLQIINIIKYIYPNFKDLLININYKKLFFILNKDKKTLGKKINLILIKTINNVIIKKINFSYILSFLKNI
ncbi:3-dehydroquinate synthase [Candidatus Vidania fulgoroideorum]